MTRGITVTKGGIVVTGKGLRDESRTVINEINTKRYQDR